MVWDCGNDAIRNEQVAPSTYTMRKFMGQSIITLIAHPARAQKELSPMPGSNAGQGISPVAVSLHDELCARVAKRDITVAEVMPSATI